MERHKRAQEESSERAGLMKSRNDLLAKERELSEAKRELLALTTKREEMTRELSDLRDARHKTRQNVITRINASVNPDILLQLEMFGNPAPYQSLLEDLLQKPISQHKSAAKQLAPRVPPQMLASFIRSADAEGLASAAEIKADLARRVIDALREPEALYAVETADMIDRPKIELLVNGEYRNSLALSTGQKCTTVLPILLLDSVNPLFVDQPEDNLDNRFVFTTVVSRLKEVKKRRQLLLVTHNPNIPVLGDAEQVFVLSADSGKGEVVKTGTVDECRNEIVTLLEGGKEAFDERGRRYAGA